MGGLWLVSYVLLWVIVVFLGVTVLALARQIGLLHKRIAPSGARVTNAGPTIGQRAPDIRAVDLQQREIVRDGTQQRPTLIAFVSVSCGTCAELLPGLKSIARSDRALLDVLIISVSDDIAANQAFVSEHRLKDMPFVASQAISLAYQVTAPPYSVIIDERNIVRAKGVTNNLEHLESLINAFTSGHASLESLHAQRHGQPPASQEVSVS